MAATTVTASAPVNGLAAVEQWFDLEERHEVVAYLERHPHLAPLLADVATAIRRYFPPTDRLRLRVLDDADTQTAQLYALVSTSLPPDDAETLLDRLDEEWWLDAVERAHGDLTIDVEPR